jgi:hypothetical protein
VTAATSIFASSLIVLLHATASAAPFNPPKTACGGIAPMLTVEKLDELLATEPAEFQMHLQYSAMQPELLPAMVRNKTGRDFYVTPDGTVFKPKDAVILDTENRLVANIEFTTEESVVNDRSGVARPLKDMRYMTMYHAFENKSGDVSPTLGTTQLRGKGVINFASASVTNGQLLLKKRDEYVFGTHEFHRSRNLDMLAKSYEDQNLPTAAHRDLRLQEFGLADTRTFVVMITYKNKLAGYTRFYDGSRGVEMEQERFGSAEPYTEVNYKGTSLGKVPTWKLPVERIFGQGAKQENPIEKMRQDPKYQGYRFMEVGRTYINSKDFTPAEVMQIKRMMFTGSKQMLEALVAEEENVNLSKILLFASSSPVGKRHYEHEYGFREISQGALGHDEVDSVYQKRYVVAENLEFRLDFADRALKEEAATESDKKARGIHILSANAESWLQNLEKQGLMYDVHRQSEWGLAYMDPQFQPVQFHTRP